MIVIVRYTFLLLACYAAVTGPAYARKVVTVPVANTIQEALQLLDDFNGSAEDFRIAIAQEVFDSTGVNAAILVDRALKRGWEPDGFVEVLEFRVYKFRQLRAQPAPFSKAIAGNP